MIVSSFGCWTGCIYSECLPVEGDTIKHHHVVEEFNFYNHTNISVAESKVSIFFCYGGNRKGNHLRHGIASS
jgi:hypothetical protein